MMPVGFINEMLDHLLGDFEIVDDAAIKRPIGVNVIRRLAHQDFGSTADGANALNSVMNFNSDD